MPYFLLVLSGTMSALASILLRVSGQMPLSSMASFSFTSTPTLLRFGAVVAYGLGFVLYALALRRVELSVAYPLMVGVTILEIFGYGLVGGDPVSMRSIIGAILILSGIFLIYTRGVL
jgi:small multidrug resistance pump